MTASLLEQLAEVLDPSRGASTGESHPPGTETPAAVRLRRAWPRGADRLSLEYVRPDGSTITGQWFDDEDRGRSVVAATPGASWADPGVVLQPDGADRRLTGLASLVAEPGSRLVVHRPERRAVVRTRAGVYSKLVRPERVTDLLQADLRARSTRAISMPGLVGADLDAGRLDWAEAPGRSLHDMIGDDEVSLGALAASGSLAGAALNALHESPPPPDLPHHTIGDEVEAAQRWLRAAQRHAWVPPRALEQLARARELLELPASESVMVHRDLHDKQLLFDGDDLTVLDVDTLALAEPAVDLANLLVHLDLRVAQGASQDRAEAVGAAFLDAYRPSQQTMERAAAYAHATRARLAGVYAFRPSQARAAERIVDGGRSSLAGRPARRSSTRRTRSVA